MPAHFAALKHVLPRLERGQGTPSLGPAFRPVVGRSHAILGTRSWLVDTGALRYREPANGWPVAGRRDTV